LALHMLLFIMTLAAGRYEKRTTYNLGNCAAGIGAAGRGSRPGHRGSSAGKGGKFIFHDEHHGIFYSLDNQQEAKKFSGKTVLLTGTIDAQKNLVHVHKIEGT
jgi:hypothetical protein